jgi:hypothetical protein
MELSGAAYRCLPLSWSIGPSIGGERRMKIFWLMGNPDDGARTADDFKNSCATRLCRRGWCRTWGRDHVRSLNGTSINGPPGGAAAAPTA